MTSFYERPILNSPYHPPSLHHPLDDNGQPLEGEPRLFSLYANFRSFPSDHIALFVVRQWRRPVVPQPNREIAASAFFARDALPADTVGSVHRRLAEVLDGRPADVHW